MSLPSSDLPKQPLSVWLRNLAAGIDALTMFVEADGFYCTDAGWDRLEDFTRATQKLGMAIEDAINRQNEERAQ